jgi:DNA ligase (NAD+)
MLSAGKAKTLADIDKWLKKIALPANEALVIEPKIDGLSASLHYVQGKLKLIATRGDGLVGQDISHIAAYLNTIPKTLPHSLDIEVRGELYLPKDTNYNTQGKPLRNNCVGLINRKEASNNLSFVHFVAYNLLNYSYASEQEALLLLKGWGFYVTPLSIAYTSEDIAKFYTEYLEEWRDAWPYETDGLIIIVDNPALQKHLDSQWIVDHHHHYAIAFKPPAQNRESPLIELLWQISRAGLLIPVARFKAIDLGGASLERATLHNAQNARNLNLALGDSLLIERANDVIPYVRDNLSRHGRSQVEQSLIISQCPSCNSLLVDEGVHLRCPNFNCDEVNIQKILYWVRKANIENMAEATVRLLYIKGLLTKIDDLYRLKASILSTLAGFGEKRIGSLLSEIEKSRDLTAINFISRLGIAQVAEKSLRKLGINSMQAFYNFNDASYVIGQNLIAWRDNPINRTLLSNLELLLNIQEDNDIPTDIKGEVCLTGKGPYPRAEIEQKLQALGYRPVSNVTKNTTLLIADSLEDTSSKLKKARSLAIAITTYKDFFKLP